jgi:hypothetical protein
MLQPIVIISPLVTFNFSFLMEYWNAGIMGDKTVKKGLFVIVFRPLNPTFHYSIIPWTRPACRTAGRPEL